MKRLSFVLALTVLAGATACDRGKLRELARVDSLRADSLVRIKDEMLNEVMTSTQFVNQPPPSPSKPASGMTVISERGAVVASASPLRTQSEARPLVPWKR